MEYLEALMREEVRSHETWYQRFKDLLDNHNNQIGSLTTDLKAEVEVRKSGNDQMTRAIEGMQGALSFLRGAAWVIMGILGVVGAGLLGWLGPKLLALFH